MAKPLPTRADLIDYNYAVAGHDGTLCDVDGELFIKPCTPAEIAFYESSVASHPDFADFMPTFLGTLTLDEQTNGSIEDAGAALLAQHNGTTVEEASAAILANGTARGGFPVAKHTVPEVVVPVKTGKRIVTNLAVVLENAAHGFIKPNILDVKLGIRLWADDAPEEKRIRFDKVTEETTHKDLGFRVAGMRVWQGPNATGPEIDEEGYKVFNKDYGRFSLNKHNVHEAFENFLFSELAGIDEELGKLVAQAFLADLDKIEKVLAGQESRMYSASLLFVFEGDGPALRNAMEEASRSPSTLVNGDEENSEEEDDEDETAGPKIYTVKVIDFAHAEWVPGKGPDTSAILGVRSVSKILENLAGI
ncbi:putative inositol polyphosphate multikinase [Mollisia scopiformis]|uniref:Kinase n=1 Tax=Mollisia scopiformis TaxID=149040 RepID=A0A194X7N4_MOLSC|nr:putative inositol polyphosphate multikinase [Mollisia scopiformis]KUJ16183.1 putative inositol polyphosphate multikinase [Mollisia scopiformis]